MKATKEQFLRFRKLHNSGEINMADMVMVCKIAKLPKDIYKDILRNYKKYLEHYVLPKRTEQSNF